MVRGLEKFKEYFKDYSENYIIIGGTACDVIIDDAGFEARATKDIDIILIVEALSKEFVLKFWEFINDGDYQRREKSEEERKYYRFIKPKTNGFPLQIELFSKIPDLMDLEGEPQLTPIPVDNDLSSLSAILMDEEYYKFTIANSKTEEGVHFAAEEALICLKAKAFLDLTQRKLKGENIDGKNIRKHKTDIFRLAVLLPSEHKVELPTEIKNDLKAFVDSISEELPDKAIFKQMGMGAIDVEQVFRQIKNIFALD
ncbi:hypothetical protein [uncultured Draconibacterium sp.]|uniref:hypothetical protein n=1 Tax=uncultured Draconibacterium sp. TaxID=1573823 RepID=UPI00325FE960